MTGYMVSRSRLRHNLQVLRQRADGTPIWAVVKGNGYGLGTQALAEFLLAEGITRFCVTEPADAAKLAALPGAAREILMLRETVDPDELRALLEHGVLLTVGSSAAADAAEAAARACGHPARVHLKIDTGMGRYGFFPDETEALLPLFARDALHICGIYTHFNCAFGDAALTNREFDAFCAAVARLRAAGKDVGTVHCCNSAAFLRFNRMKLDGVRLGSALLGRMPFPTELQPVGYVQTRVDALHTVPAGHSTGYSALWTAKRQTTLAILPVGWFHGFNVSCQPDRSRRCDGLRAALSGLKDMLRPRRLTVEINGVPCPIVGAIGMLHCAADVTGLSCAPGDPVVMQLNPLHRNELPVVFTD